MCDGNCVDRGWFNERPSNHAEACPAYADCPNYSPTRGPIRFTTWADDKDLSGLCYQHVPLIAFNNYLGWHNQPGGQECSTKLLERDGRQCAGRSHAVWHRCDATVGKPLIISEAGAGGIFEWQNNATGDKWALKKSDRDHLFRCGRSHIK